MNYYKIIKDRIIEEEIYYRIKDYSKEKHRLISYYDIGKMLYTAGNKYDENYSIEEIDNYICFLRNKNGPHWGPTYLLVI